MGTRAELEAMIDASPTDDAPYVILGDWLQIHGDPRGELIALDAMAARAPSIDWSRRRRELLARHPELAPPPSKELRLGWHLGFVRSVGVDRQRWIEQLDHPAFRFVTEIVWYEPGHEELAEQIAELAARFPLLRAISIGDPEARWHQPARTEPIDLAALVPQHAQLERVFSIEPLVLAGAHRLRTLDQIIDRDTLRRLAETALPALEELGLRRRSSYPPSTDQPALDDLRWLFERPPPRLCRLALELELPGDDLVAALACAPLRSQLRRLQLWNANLTRVGARHLTREAFGHLELLDLSDPLLDDETIALVRDVCREVRTISPWMREITHRPG